MRNITLLIIIALTSSSCLTYDKVISDLNIELESRYNAVFFDEAIETAHINVNEVDTLYVLERFNDIIWNYDRGVIWTNKGEMHNFTLETPKKHKDGIPYRFYTGINILANDTCSHFDLEMQLLNNWNTNKIQEIDTRRQIITDGTLIAVRIIRNKKKYKSDYFVFSDLRDYSHKIKN